ncbi:MAG: hypothetical protein GY926_20610, partial [bacterium]|nr:hypothetical protein [bacterium]
MPGSALLVGSFEAGGAGSPDLVTSTTVFVFGGDVADSFMQPDAVVVDPEPFKLSGEDSRDGDRQEVREIMINV